MRKIAAQLEWHTEIDRWEGFEYDVLTVDGDERAVVNPNSNYSDTSYSVSINDSSPYDEDDWWSLSTIAPSKQDAMDVAVKATGHIVAGGKKNASPRSADVPVDLSGWCLDCDEYGNKVWSFHGMGNERYRICFDSSSDSWSWAQRKNGMPVIMESGFMSPDDALEDLMSGTGKYASWSGMCKSSSYRDDLTLMSLELGMTVEELEEEIFSGRIEASGDVYDLVEVAIEILEQNKQHFWEIDAIGDFFNFEAFAQAALSRPGFIGDDVKYYWFGTTFFTVPR